MTVPRRLRQSDWREPALLALAVIAQAIVNWHFASQSYFVADDLVHFEETLTGGYTPDFLFGLHGGHLSPGRRAVMLFLQRHAPFDYDLALGILVVAQSISVVLVQRILRLLFGVRWWTVAVAFAFGISIVVQPSLQWFTAGVLIVPATTLGLAAIHGYLCWWRTGRRAWLVWSAIAVAGGLAFYIKGILVPLYILLIRVFLLEPGRSLREGVRAAVREWPWWVAYAVPVVAALAIYLTGDSGNELRDAPLHLTDDYLRIAWSAGFVPSLFGIRLPESGDSTFHAVVVAGSQLALVGAAALSIARRREAWRPWALVLFVFLLNAVVVLPRLGLGANIAYTLRYYTEALYFAAIVIPFAFALPRGDRAPVERLALPRRAILAPAVAALLLYTGFAWASHAAFTRHWIGPGSRDWFENVRGDLAALRHEHVDPVLLDGQVPSDILIYWAAPQRVPRANSFVAVFSLFAPDVRFNEVSARTYRVRDDGHLEPVTFVRAAGGDPRALGDQGLVRASGAYAVRGRGLCLGRGGRTGTFEWRPTEALRGPVWYLRTTYRTDPAGSLFLAPDLGVGYPKQPDRVLPPRRRRGTSLTEVGAIPGAVPTLAGVRFDVPVGHRACLRRLVVGSYVARGRTVSG